MGLTKAVTDFVNDVFDQPCDIGQVVSTLYDEKALINGPFGRQIGTLDVREHWRRWAHAFCNNEPIFELIQGKNTIVGLWTLKGKHVGNFSGVEATGKEVICQGMSTYHFNEHGKVYAHNYQADLMSLYKQMGYHFTKETYPKQSMIKSDYELLLGTLMKMGKDKNVISKRETLMLTFYVNGRSAKEIGEWFKIHFRTVQTHINNGMHKLGCHSKNQLHEFIKSVGLSYVFRDLYDLLMQRPQK